MPNYNYNLAGINIRLDIPFSLHITEESEAFIRNGESEEEYLISFTKSDDIAPVPENGTWIDDACYINTEESENVFFRNRKEEEPYAHVLADRNGLQCRYVEDQEKIFLDTRGILNHIGLESILLKKQSIMLHASFIRWNGNGILFSAPCGMGKSTQASLWEKHMSCDIINGDRAAIRRDNDAWTAFGLPFAGTSKIYRNESVPLAAIVVLEKGMENTIKRLSVKDAFYKLLPEISCRRWDSDFMNGLIDLLLKMMEQIPVYLLSCRADKHAVELLYQTLKRDERL